MNNHFWTCLFKTDREKSIQTYSINQPIDKQYLLFKSCHPRHTKTSIPFSLARRLKTIISDDNTLNKRLSELNSYLKKQNYPSNIITTGIEKVMQLNRNTLLTTEVRTNNNVIPFISTFHPVRVLACYF